MLEAGGMERMELIKRLCELSPNKDRGKVTANLAQQKSRLKVIVKNGIYYLNPDKCKKFGCAWYYVK